MTRPEFLSRLNELLAEELEACIRYFHMSTTLRGMDRRLAKDILIENMNETLEHASEIAEKVVQLGGCPEFELRVKLEPKKVTAKDALHTAVTVERAALDAYRELLEQVTNDDEDIVLEEFLRKQVTVEAEHVRELELLLDEDGS